MGHSIGRLTCNKTHSFTHWHILPTDYYWSGPFQYLRISGVDDVTEGSTADGCSSLPCLLRRPLLDDRGQGEHGLLAQSSWILESLPHQYILILYFKTLGHQTSCSNLNANSKAIYISTLLCWLGLSDLCTVRLLSLPDNEEERVVIFQSMGQECNSHKNPTHVFSCSQCYDSEIPIHSFKGLFLVRRGIPDDWWLKNKSVSLRTVFPWSTSHPPVLHWQSSQSPALFIWLPVGFWLCSQIQHRQSHVTGESCINF